MFPGADARGALVLSAFSSTIVAQIARPSREDRERGARTQIRRMNESMPVEQQQIDRAAQIRNGLEQLKNSLDYDAKKKEIAEIDKQMAESGFWDDQEKSQTVVARIKALKALALRKAHQFSAPAVVKHNPQLLLQVLKE